MLNEIFRLGLTTQFPGAAARVEMLGQPSGSYFNCVVDRDAEDCETAKGDSAVPSSYGEALRRVLRMTRRPFSLRTALKSRRSSSSEKKPCVRSSASFSLVPCRLMNPFTGRQ